LRAIRASMNEFQLELDCAIDRGFEGSHIHTLSVNLEAVIKESLGLTAVIPLVASHVYIADIDRGGVGLPAGGNCRPCIYLVHAT